MPNNSIDIDEVLNLARFSERWHKPDEFLGVTLILKDASQRRGQNGEFYVMTCLVEASNEEVFISTGASQPLMVIQSWIAAGRRPVRFSFLKEGRTTQIVKALDAPPF